MHLASIDILLIAIYCAFVLAIGFLLRRQMVGSAEFLMAGRSMPAWVAGLAFLSANLGAQEMIGMAASGAKYGILTSHFYWVGAIPAMAFVGVFMMPFYYGSRARSVPAFRCGIATLGPEASASTCPPSSAVIAGPPPA